MDGDVTPYEQVLPEVESEEHSLEIPDVSYKECYEKQNMEQEDLQHCSLTLNPLNEKIEVTQNQSSTEADVKHTVNEVSYEDSCDDKIIDQAIHDVISHAISPMSDKQIEDAPNLGLNEFNYVEAVTEEPYESQNLTKLEPEENAQASRDIPFDACCKEPIPFKERISNTSVIANKLRSETPHSSSKETDDFEYTETIPHLNSEEETTKVANLHVEQCLFLCNTCSDNGRMLPATVSCTDCLELYCNECSGDHKSFKATKSHLLNQHNDLQMKKACEPCANKGMYTKRPSHFCIECNEAQCDDCRTRHQRLKMTRNHKLVPCTGIEVISKPDANSINIDINLEKKEKQARKPGKPCVGAITIDHIILAWDAPEELFQDHSYQLRYKECSVQMKWVFYPETLSQPSVTLHNLKSGTQFLFQVRMVDDDNEGPYSELSDPVETIASAAEHLLGFMCDVEKPDVGMQLKSLPLQENKDARNDIGKTRKLHLGDDNGVCTKERTILLVGATGTGKSTLVDGMINYVLGVKWSDPYRLTLVNLEKDEIQRNVDQAISQTQWITCYAINPYSGGRLDYKLNIIDTPGFGDTRGIERDKQIVQQIKHLFSREDDAGVLFIDAICFIIKAPDARLTPTQMYIFNAIMSLFGQDIENNFSMLITFADGKQPPVLSALKKANLPHDEYFPFNNSGLFADNSGSNESDFASMFWNMGCQSFEKFFKRLAKMETKSLRQTRDVLTYREKVEMTMENLMPLVDAGLSKVEETRIEIAILNDFQTQIEANSDFKYTVTETQQKQIDLPKGQHVTNCLNCHFTCHQNCGIPNDEDKKGCWAMDWNGYCTQCPDKCVWNIHRNTPYIFEYVSVQKVKTYAEKLEKYRLATDETMTREKVVERMHEEMCDLEDEIFHLMDQINECNNILRKIALRPDPLSLVEHIDLLIESEKQEKRSGFQRRIASLQQCRRRATIGDEIDRFDAGFTDTASKITAQVKLPVKRERKNRKGLLGFFQPVVNYFMKK